MIIINFVITRKYHFIEETKESKRRRRQTVIVLNCYNSNSINDDNNYDFMF